MSLPTPPTVEKLQAVLRDKAKTQPDFRFYALYDKVYRSDVLLHAYRRCLQNKGAAGVDGQSFDEIRAYGVGRWLGELAEELRTKTYRPQAVKRVWLPKDDGSQRPLGIPTIRDRVVQMAVLLVIGPIFDQDLPPEQHAYRAGHSAQQALQQVQYWLKQGYTEVVDADLSGYFDSIPHHELMRCVARRISEGSLLHLVKMWLEAAVEETDERGHTSRSTRHRDDGRGTPQGGVLSPLLANLYMRRFVLGWKQNEQRRLDTRLVNYADDFVICCREGQSEQALVTMRQMMERLRLTVNEKKTKRCRVEDGETFTFLGYTFGYQVSRRTGKPYIGPTPAGKKVLSISKRIGALTSVQTQGRSVAEVVHQLNETIVGWCNYFRLGFVSQAWRIVQGSACRGLRRWLRRKHQGRGGQAGPPDLTLYQDYGLVDVRRRYGSRT